MMVIISKNYNEMSKRAAKLVIDEILKKPNLRLGCPTGQTPSGMYKELVKAYKEKKADFSKVHAYMLDEYYPIKKTSKNSYNYYLNDNFFNHVNIKKENINTINPESKTPKKECVNYEKKLRKNPVDIQILGVGVNGHIGFNEPNSNFNSKTRIVNLTESTIKQNSRFFKNKEQAPKQTITLGIETIMSAKKIILLASGKNKTEAIKHLINEKEDKSWPVTALRKHKNLIVIADKDAVSLLRQSN